MLRRKNKATTTSKAVMGIGALVTGLGRLVGGRVGDSITGFGLAHIVLGAIDMFRPSTRFR
ncbi:MAG: hypothetical protein ACN4A7_08420 [Thermacetogeniaceae bacterium]|nr:hypothetical protein [Thermoanaerobacterales bacterium]NLN20713.1 hypothetical protein [Syntrophomonadaceae bacterium]HAF17366.1 hypothetical protein [Peptococcaceae bacterium]